MRIDSAGIPLPDPPQPLVADWHLWHCPSCSAPTWAGVTNGEVVARLCQPCQATTDLAAVEVARITHYEEIA